VTRTTCTCTPVHGYRGALSGHAVDEACPFHGHRVTAIVIGAPACRVVIAGVPKSGKTTLAGPCARHTDDLLHEASRLEWSQISDTVAAWFDAPGPWIVEGVRTVHALRKWLRAHATGRPCDRVIWMGTPLVPLDRGQAVMGKGCATVWREIRPVLLARGVAVEEP
jgi:hypothetical protein